MDPTALQPESTVAHAVAGESALPGAQPPQAIADADLFKNRTRPHFLAIGPKEGLAAVKRSMERSRTVRNSMKSAPPVRYWRSGGTACLSFALPRRSAISGLSGSAFPRLSGQRPSPFGLANWPLGGGKQRG
jgi:hypothetical protein